MTQSIRETENCNAREGRVRWAPVKSIWFNCHLLTALIGGYMTVDWTVIGLFVVSSGITLCLGHSLGMHRRLIHVSYDCPRWLEYLFVYLGVVVGMAGPLGMMWQHDLRDWAQRQARCHAYLRHGSPLWRDAWWQLNCDLELDDPPQFAPRKAVADDRFYDFLERSWMWQQLPWVLLLYSIGGWSWIIWGVCARVSVSLTGHWFIGYLAHNRGPRRWHVLGAAVQGHNVPLAGLLTMGESWHNNHHAFPGTARLGLYRGETDPGWWVLCLLDRLGLVWSIRLPEDLPPRPELYNMTRSGVGLQQ